MEIKTEVSIQRPVNEVFEFLSNFENMPKWNYYVMNVSKTTEGPISRGTTFHQVRKSDAQDYKVIEFEYPNLVTIETLPPGRHLIMRFKLSKTKNGTRVEDEWQLEVPWLLSVFGKSQVKSAIKANLEKLKNLLETGKVVLQDGRLVQL